MVTVPHPPRLTLPLAPAGAALAGGVIALGFLVMPGGLLEDLVMRSGVPAVLAAAAPPLGFTARIALALVCGGGVGAFVLVALRLLVGARRIDLRQVAKVVKRSDVHCDGPPRPPLFANRELGRPFLEIKAAAAAPPSVPRAVERDLPADLDQPMAAFDPAAVPIVPRPAPEPVAPLIRPQLIDPGDRFETFEMTPVRQPAPPPSLRAPAAERPPATASHEVERPAAPAAAVVAPATEASVTALLARLERGLADNAGPAAAPPRTGSLSDTLSDLRRLATTAG